LIGKNSATPVLTLDQTFDDCAKRFSTMRLKLENSFWRRFLSPAPRSAKPYALHSIA